jgi:hypothetical protein
MLFHIRMMRGRIAALTVSLAMLSVAHASDDKDDVGRGDEKNSSSDRNWLVVPVPISDPTIGSGLVLGGAYFYPQTADQQASQPASVTGAGGFYTDSDSKAFAVGHQAYLKEDVWRLAVAAGAVDLNLKLRSNGAIGERDIDWGVEGYGFYIEASRAVFGEWRLGVFARYLDFDEEFSVAPQADDFVLEASTVGAGIGFEAEYDSRDTPYNPRRGSRLKVGVLANNEIFGGDDNYESYSVNYTSYHDVLPSVVVAWQLRGCHRSDDTPLWDACVINLRGFPVIDYLGKSSVLGQVEARWQFYKRWGAVAFAGAGNYANSFNEFRENETIPSYGVGLRFMVVPSQRINVRLDYGRSKDNDAIHLGVMEAF